MAHLTGAFSEKISRGADDTILSVISVVVLVVTTAVGAGIIYALVRVIGSAWN